MKIGLYDSGLGGLSILKSLAAALPEYDYLFYGDTKSLPLGNKTEEEIYACTQEGVRYLFEHECVLVIVACNTASAETLRRLQDTFLIQEYPDRKILGVIIPTIEELLEHGSKRALLIGTKRTVGSGKYHLELGKRNVEDVKIHAVATPELVPLIEAGELDTAFVRLKEIIATEGQGADTLILGCTHYILLKDRLRKAYSEQLNVLSQDEIIPEKLKLYLHNHSELEMRITRGGTRVVHLTEHKEKYDALAEGILGGVLIGL